MDSVGVFMVIETRSWDKVVKSGGCECGDMALKPNLRVLTLCRKYELKTQNSQPGVGRSSRDVEGFLSIHGSGD